MFLEVCVDSVRSAQWACEAGADRLELCLGLDVGGVTPPGSLVSAVVRSVSCPVIALIRPRPGHFVYDATEMDWMLDSIRESMDRGASGIAVGALNRDFSLDRRLLGRARDAMSEGQLVMHRAFDLVADKPTVVENLIELGYDRILTSGGPVHAIDGLEILRQLVAVARDRIQIMAGGGISVDNAPTILAQSGCGQIHGSFRSPPVDLQAGRQVEDHFGSHRLVDPSAIAQVRQACGHPGGPSSDSIEVNDS